MFWLLITILPHPVFNVSHRETRENVGPAVETEVKGDSKRTNERDPFLAGLLGLSCHIQEIFVLPWLLYSRPGTKYFSSSHTISISLCPNRPASWAGSRAGSPVFQCTSLVSQNKCILVLCSTWSRLICIYYHGFLRELKKLALLSYKHAPRIKYIEIIKPNFLGLFQSFQSLFFGRLFSCWKCKTISKPSSIK